MKTLLTFGLLAFTLTAQATVYLVAYDPISGAMGQAVSSSGPAYVDSSRFQIREHGLGMVGAGGLGLCGKAKPRTWLQQGLGAQEIADKVARACDRAKPYYRLAVVTANGEIALHLGPQGCNSHNHNCTKIQGEHAGVIGGGLKAGVAEKMFSYFNSLDPAIGLECRLLSTLKQTYADGGEFKNFIVANIVVSYPGRARANIWQSKGNESSLLSKLASKMRASGVDCR